MLGEQFDEAGAFALVLADDHDAAGVIATGHHHKFVHGLARVLRKCRDAAPGQFDPRFGRAGPGGELVQFAHRVRALLEDLEHGGRAENAFGVGHAFVVAAGLFDDFHRFREDRHEARGHQFREADVRVVALHGAEVRGDQFDARDDAIGRERFRIDLADAFDFVTEVVEPHGHGFARAADAQRAFVLFERRRADGKNVHDTASHAEVAWLFDRVDALVPRARQPRGERLRRGLLARRDAPDQLARCAGRLHALHQRLDRRDHDRAALAAGERGEFVGEADAGGDQVRAAAFRRAGLEGGDARAGDATRSEFFGGFVGVVQVGDDQ